MQTRRLGEQGADALCPLWILKYLPNMFAAHISMAFNAQGPNNTIATACAAGTQAVGEGFRLIARDDADIILAGGADSRIDPLLMLAYTALGALSHSDRPASEISRPFDGKRDGFVLGEGAGLLVLEELEHAKKRGAMIYAEVLGMGSSFDAFAVTKPDPDARGAARAITSALRKHASTTTTSITSTPTAPAPASTTKWRPRPSNAYSARGPRSLPLSSIKSMVGHLIGAAGAVEAVATALTLKSGVLPPTINQTQKDPVCDLDYVPNTAREMPTRVAVSTSFGFGGQNAALVMRSFQG